MESVDYRHPLTPGARTPRYRPALHAIALWTAIATFPLIFIGGLVTSHGAGMAVPDWPNSYGYNMFTFPPSQWIGGIFYEHTHRLYASFVGLLSIAVCVAAWMLESRRWVRWLATSLLAAVIFQGVLGGLRVIWVNLDLAIAHACFAQAFFVLATSVAVVTSRWWHETPDHSRSTDGATGRRLIALAAACLFAIYLQLIIGAVMRHESAGLAIPDLPLAYGKLLPLTDGQSLQTINAQRAWNYQMDPVTLPQVWWHFAHRVGAVIVSIIILALTWRTIVGHRQEDRLFRPAVFLAALLCLQLALGVLTVLLRKPADIASAHVAVGALILVTTSLIMFRAMRLYSLAFRSMREEREPIQTRPELAPA